MGAALGLGLLWGWGCSGAALGCAGRLWGQSTLVPERDCYDCDDGQLVIVTMAMLFTMLPVLTMCSPTL